MKLFLFNCIVILIAYSTTIHATPQLVSLEKKGLSHFDHDVFFPIGWSKDGKFAYALQRANLAGEPYSYLFIIQSLINDKILWKFEQAATEGSPLDKPFNQLECNRDCPQKRFNIVWELYQKTIKQFLTKHHIDHNRGPWYAANQNVILYEKEKLHFKKKEQTIENKSFAGVNCLLDYRLIMQSSRGIKKLTHKKFNERYCPITIHLKGAYKSPFEERIAIVLAHHSLGYEGTMNHYTVIGASLSKGFK